MLTTLPPNKLMHSPCHYYKLQLNEEYGFWVTAKSYKISSKSTQHFLTWRMQYIGRCADRQTDHPNICSFSTHHTTGCNKMTKHRHRRVDMTIVGAEISTTTRKVYCNTHLKLRFHTQPLPTQNQWLQRTAELHPTVLQKYHTFCQYINKNIYMKITYSAYFLFLCHSALDERPEICCPSYTY